MSSKYFLAIEECINRNKKEEAKKLINEATKNYYEDGSSPLLDSEWDTLILTYKTKFDEDLGTTGSAIKEKQKERKIYNQADKKHDYPLLYSFLDSKPKTDDEIYEWLLKKFKACKNEKGLDFSLLASSKIDGQSLINGYDKEGKVLSSISRGDDGAGTDVSYIFKSDLHFPGGLPEKYKGKSFGIKYEAAMTWKDLELLNEENNKERKNPRNTIAGIMRKKDALNYKKFIRLCPLDIEIEDYPNISRMERLEVLESLIQNDITKKALSPIDGNIYFEWFVYDLSSEKDIISYFKDLSSSIRKNIDPRSLESLMFDGIVLEFIDSRIINLLGGRSTTPSFIAGIKYPAEEEISYVKDIEWDVGASGRYTPCVIIEPVNLIGNTYQRISISNMKRFDELKLCKGTPVLFSLRGDVLGYINRHGEDPIGSIPFVEPKDLSFSYDKDGKRVFAYKEPPLDGRIERLLIKFGVKGILRKQIEKLIEGKIISSIYDIFLLTPSKVKTVRGFDETQSNFVCSEIENSIKEGVEEYRLLAALGIPLIGNTISKKVISEISLTELVDSIKSSELEEVMKQKLQTIEGIGEENSYTILNGIKDHLDEIYKFSSMLKIIDTTRKKKEFLIPSKKLVVTGPLENYERDEFKDLVEGLGHKMVNAISGNVDYLITNTPLSGTTKNAKAKLLQKQGHSIKIVTEKEIIEILQLPKKEEKKTWEDVDSIDVF